MGSAAGSRPFGSLVVGKRFTQRCLVLADREPRACGGRWTGTFPHAGLRGGGPKEGIQLQLSLLLPAGAFSYFIARFGPERANNLRSQESKDDRGGGPCEYS